MASNTTAGWANTNKATVWPRLGVDTENGGSIWGEPYEIDCTWRSPKGEQRTVIGPDQGKETVVKTVIYTEDVRPQIYDDIMIHSTQPERVKILDRNEDDMSMFDEPPTFELRV